MGHWVWGVWRSFHCLHCLLLRLPAEFTSQGTEGEPTYKACSGAGDPSQEMKCQRPGQTADCRGPGGDSLTSPAQLRPSFIPLYKIQGCSFNLHHDACWSTVHNRYLTETTCEVTVCAGKQRQPETTLSEPIQFQKDIFSHL